MVRKFREYFITSGGCFESAKVNPTISSRDSDTGSHANPIRKSIKYGTTFQAAKGIFFEYFNDSSIHGLKYLSDPKRSAIERIVWLCAICLSIVTCCFFIKNIWDKYNSTPIIITISEKQADVWDIPFPTVTICAEAKSDPNIFNFASTFWKVQKNETLTEEEQYYWEAVSQLCRPNQRYGMDIANSSDLIRAMESASQFIDREHFRCRWMRKFKCDILPVVPILTSEGICYSFNSLNGSHFIRDEYLDSMNYAGRDPLNWDLEQGYSKVAEETDFYPNRAQGSETVFTFITLIPKYDDIVCRMYKGFKLVVHSPGELPDVSENFISIPYNLRNSISIEPKVVYTSKELEKYEPRRRQCYFPNERPLRYFKYYSKANCEQECLSNLTFAQCGCVKFSMPRHSSRAVCGSKKVYCLQYAKEDLALYQRREKRNCDCLPSCISIQYNAEVEQKITHDFFEEGEALHANGAFKDLKEYGNVFVELKVHFKDDVFNALKRSELYTATDLIANCGGLLGLFMGVSILSLVEFVYFFTVRLWVNLKMRRTKQLQLRKFKENAESK